jgi:two-component system phosphate regulon response regulator PhoB
MVAESRAHRSAPRRGSTRPCALIAGADAAIRQLLRTLLEIGGFEVVEASSQGEVLARLASRGQTADVVILDVLLPTFSGLATLSYLRREPRVAQVPVIVLTSFADGPEHARFSQSGATAVMTKPFSSTRLLRLVNEVVAAGR